jgi:hypothetical protein
MAIIYSYPPSGGILATDTLVGTSTVIVGGRTKNQTKSFSIGSLATFITTNVLIDYVPYTGAIGPVNLGEFDLTVNSITVGRGTGSNDENTVFGLNALLDNTTGYWLTSFGRETLSKNTTGIKNSAIGNYALWLNTTGLENAGIGYGVLSRSISGNYNTGVGTYPLYWLASGSNNTAVGRASGVWIADGITPLTTASNSTFLGTNAKALQDDSTNEIVIGAETIGQGSNTITLGNANITKTILRGNIGIGTIAPNNLLDVVKNQPQPTRINIENIDAAGTSTIRFTNLTGAAAALFENSTNQFTFQNATNGGNIRFQTTNMLGATLTALIVDSDQSVGVGVTIIEKTAKLQVDSNSKGFLPPRMTSSEREDIVSPANGLIVYDTNLQTFCGYADNGWKTFRMDII